MLVIMLIVLSVNNNIRAFTQKAKIARKFTVRQVKKNGILGTRSHSVQKIVLI